jgi:hypothetical protein
MVMPLMLASRGPPTAFGSAVPAFALVSIHLFQSRSPILQRLQGEAPYRRYATLAASTYIRSGLIPLPDHSALMIYGNEVMDLTIFGLLSM